MKICHVISGYFRNDARVFHRQCKSLQKQNNEVVILSNDGGRNEKLDGIEIFSCNVFLKKRIFVLLFATFQFFFSAKKINADIYQFHSPELIFLGLYFKLIGKKVIYDAHEDLPRHILEKEWLLWMPTFLRKFISLATEQYLFWALKKYDRVITPHHHVLELFKKNGIECTLVANFPIIKNKKNFLLDDYLIRKKVICYTGTVYSYSNQEEILEAISDLKDVRYKIVGFFDEAHLNSLSSHKAFNQLDFSERIPWERLSEFYEMTSVGIVVYDYKLNLGGNLGSYGSNKLFEYMEAGLPLVCTDYKLWKEIIDEYKCGIYVKPGNVSEIKNAISFLLENKELAYKYGQNGRRAVEEKFNWSLHQKEYLKIFQNI